MEVKEAESLAFCVDG